MNHTHKLLSFLWGRGGGRLRLHPWPSAHTLQPNVKLLRWSASLRRADYWLHRKSPPVEELKWRDYISHLILSVLLEEVAGERKAWTRPLKLLPPDQEEEPELKLRDQIRWSAFSWSNAEILSLRVNRISRRKKPSKDGCRPEHMTSTNLNLFLVLDR